MSRREGESGLANRVAIEVKTIHGNVAANGEICLIVCRVGRATKEELVKVEATHRRIGICGIDGGCSSEQITDRGLGMSCLVDPAIGTVNAVVTNDETSVAQAIVHPDLHRVELCDHSGAGNVVVLNAITDQQTIPHFSSAHSNHSVDKCSRSWLRHSKCACEQAGHGQELCVKHSESLGLVSKVMMYFK